MYFNLFKRQNLFITNFANNKTNIDKELLNLRKNANERETSIKDASLSNYISDICRAKKKDTGSPKGLSAIVELYSL